MKIIIVLGSSNEIIRKLRVERAVSYFFEIQKQFEESDPFSTANAIIIFSGKGGEKESEAQCMYNYATKTLKVDSKYCCIEDESMNTEQNIKFSKLLLEKYKFFNPTFKKLYTFVICTSTFHSRRSLMIALFNLSDVGIIKIIHTNEIETETQIKKESLIIYNYLSRLIDM